jgi:DNA-binding transcriptional MerR regulator
MDYTIGELARHSGVSTRTLRHYDQLGLVRPSGRTPAGYRVYTDRDVLALHRVLAYQQMGLALKEIGPLLGPDGPPLEAVLDRQIATVEAEVARQQRLLVMLRRVQRRACENSPDMADHLLKLLGFMRTYQRYFSDAELQKVVDFQTSLGDDGLRRMKREFDEAITGLRDAMERGQPADSEATLPFARRVLAFKKQFREDDDPEVRARGRAMFAENPALLEGTGLTLPLLDYMDQAVEAAKKKENAR